MAVHHDPTVAQMVRAVLQLLRPYRLIGGEKVRIGRMFDGGYVMVDRFAGMEAAYSLGINDDVSWDHDIASRGIPVYQYDHTIPHLPREHPLFRWAPKCISGIADPENGVETLPRLLGANGHAASRNLLLKCDIEWSEWLLLQETPNTTIAQFRQIVMEVHNFAFLANPGDAENVRRAILNLTASHRVVHVHANNFGTFDIIGGIAVPQVLELTLLRKDEGELVPSDETFPTPLDMPCRAGDADLYLGRFVFDER